MNAKKQMPPPPGMHKPGDWKKAHWKKAHRKKAHSSSYRNTNNLSILIIPVMFIFIFIRCSLTWDR